MRAGRQGRAVGHDQVSQELLLAICQQADGLRELTCFFNRVLFERVEPAEWRTTIITLLAKTPHPSSADHLRPIALSSHVCKTYSRAVLQRILPALQPRGPEQHAWATRQPADAIFAAMQVAQASLEWGTPIAFLKLDLARAFDSLDREAVARTLLDEEWHDAGAHVMGTNFLPGPSWS